MCKTRKERGRKGKKEEEDKINGKRGLIEKQRRKEGIKEKKEKKV